MIERIGLKFGSSPIDEKLKIEITPITVFVGPNNSGKSKVLKEINQFCSSGQFDQRDVIIEEIQLNKMEESLGNMILSHLIKEPGLDQTLPEGHIILGDYRNRQQIPQKELKESFTKPNEGH